MSKSKDEAIKTIQESDKTEFEVFDTEEHTTFLENHLESEVEKRIKGDIGKIHQQYDDDLFEIFGKRKSTSQKTYNFLKEEFTALQEKAKGVPELQAKIDELKESIKNGAGSEQIKKDLDSMQKQFKDSKQEWDTEKASLLSKNQEMMLGNEIDKALVGLKFKESIPQKVRDIMLGAVKDDLISQAKIEDGKLFFVDKEGATLRNKDNALNPYSANEMLRERLKDIIGDEIKIPGTGVKPEITGEGDKKTINIAIPAVVKTKTSLIEYLLSQGLTRQSEEYKLAYKKYSVDLPHN